jgi:hypothetical protein
MGDYETLSTADKKSVIGVVKQEHLEYLFINNSKANCTACSRRTFPTSTPKETLKRITVISTRRLLE